MNKKETQKVGEGTRTFFRTLGIGCSIITLPFFILLGSCVIEYNISDSKYQKMIKTEIRSTHPEYSKEEVNKECERIMKKYHISDNKRK